MKIVDFLIVGGSAAGTTAAEVIRMLKPGSSIAIVTDEDEEYSRVLLSPYNRNKIKREQVFLKTPQWYKQKNIELIKKTRAISLDPSNHLVGISGGGQIQYGKLLLAIGGSATRLKVSGSELENILYFRTLDDTDKILKTLGHSKKAVIVGGGLISLDLVSCCKANNVTDITILVKGPYYWSSRLDPDSSHVMVSILSKNGVKVVDNEELDHFEGEKVVQAVITKSGKRFECDVVGVGIGIKTDMEWVMAAGVKTNRGILTNEYLETNVSDVYAAGDCAEFYDTLFEKQHVMGNWMNATSQGQIVAKAMVGEKTVFETVSSYSDSFFDMHYSFIGEVDKTFADEVMNRGSVEVGKMTQIFLKTIDGVMRIIGATVINNAAEVAPLTAAIKKRVDVMPYKDKLSDMNFNLNHLIN